MDTRIFADKNMPKLHLYLSAIEYNISRGLRMRITRFFIFTFILIFSLVLINCEEVDTTPPVVTITSPQNGSIVSEIISITCMATDDGKIDKVELWIDGMSSGVDDNSEPYSMDWNTVPYEDGTIHTIIVRSYDNSENITDSSPVSLTIDNSGSYPTPVELFPITFIDNSFIISWSPSIDDDFLSYQLFESTTEEMINSNLVFETNTKGDTSFIYTSIEDNELRFFQVIVQDIPGLASNSNIQVASTALFIYTFGAYMSEKGRCILQTLDGGYILLGTTQSFGAGLNDFWLIKVSSLGIEEWSKTFGGSENDRGYSVDQTDDGGYIITGETYSFGSGYNDVWLIKTDAEGNEEWSKTFGGSNLDRGYSAQQTTDGGYVVVGYTSVYGHDLEGWLIKTDAFGNQMWEKKFGWTGRDSGYSVRQTLDGGYIVTGLYGVGAENDLWLLKTNSSGTEMWDRMMGASYYDRGYSVEETNDGGFIIVGATKSTGSGKDSIWLIKTNSTGIELWSEIFGGDDSDVGYSVTETSDGGFILVGSTESFGNGLSDVWLIKTDLNGNSEWNKTFGGYGSDEGYSVTETSDGGFILVGSTESFGNGSSDLWLIKTDALGNTVAY